MQEFLNKVSGLLQHSYFPVNFAKNLRTPFLVNTSGGYFLKRRAEHIQFKNELRTKQNTNSKLF